MDEEKQQDENEGEGTGTEQAQEEQTQEQQPVLLYNALLFNKYDLSEVRVSDPGLVNYINLSPIYVPHTSGRHANLNFAKRHVNIVERLVNQMMRTENFTGKKTKALKVVMETLEIIEKKTNRNPVQVLVEAIEHAAPREEITRLQFGGISVPRAVDVSSSRRLDLALRLICQGAINASHGSTKPIAQCLADEITLASQGDMTSYAVSKRDETERVAMSAR
ncbi:MAG: 30S ribosomal protein S7 [Methanomassiliicoccales archaeon]